MTPEPLSSPSADNLGNDDLPKLTARYAIPSEVIDRRVDDETVILHLGTNIYYGVDPVGSRMWELIVSGQSLMQIRDKLLLEYDVEAEELEQDLRRLAMELLIRGLINDDSSSSGS